MVFHTILARTIAVIIGIALVLMLLVKMCSVENLRYYEGTVIKVFHCEDNSCAVSIRYHNDVVMDHNTFDVVGEGFTQYLRCHGDKDIEKATCYLKRNKPEGVKKAEY